MCNYFSVDSSTLSTCALQVVEMSDIYNHMLFIMMVCTCVVGEAGLR